MKKINTALLGLALILGFSLTAFSQEEKSELVLDLGYFVPTNNVPYLDVHIKTKVDEKLKTGKKFIDVPGINVSVYLNEESDNNLLGKLTTGESGKARVVIQPGMKAAWDAADKHNFIAVAEGTNLYDEARTEIEITKAKIVLEIDTADGIRQMTAKVMEFSAGNWVPIKDVEVNIEVQRLSGFLLAGDDEYYTTDEEGQVSTEFTKENLPGDKEGNLILRAGIEDNETYGNLYYEQSAPWGIPQVVDNSFNKRTLFATRDKAPIWLLVMVYSIVISVWGTLIYLVLQLFAIKKSGKLAE